MPPKLIVGLGNPGADYQKTRHNAGFMAVERLAQRHGMSGPKHKFHAGILEGQIKNNRCLLMQPMTFMNRSGLAVGEAVRFYKLDPESDVLIIVDEVALPIGRIRLRGKGSAGGHNGLADIQRALGTDGYPRLRIGIDPPGRVPQVDYVLGRFNASQMDELDPALDRTCDAVEMWLVDGLERAMTNFNSGGGNQGGNNSTV